MKIKRIQISGFRGIPPVSPPDVDINLVESGEIKDLLLFGPNAYGKSSIADALEWFFKEDVRSSAYFDDYCAEDNVHLNLGKQDFEPNAFIELILSENGNEYSVRKELDCDGIKSSEDLGGIQAILSQAQNEIIVLDHDQFRDFVSAANKDKWETFSSLIGFEQLDHFRNGLDSVTRNSLSSYLDSGNLNNDVETRDEIFQVEIRQAIDEFECIGTSLDDLINHFTALLEANLSSLALSIPERKSINEEFWSHLQSQVQTPSDVVQAANRLSSLTLQKNQLSSFSGDFQNNLDNLNTLASELTKDKDAFDKELLSEFYKIGIQILAEGKSTVDQCPFCSTPFSWDDLSQHVQEHATALNFSSIQQNHQKLLDCWHELKNELQNRRSDFVSASITAIQSAYQEIADFNNIENALSLSSFDETQVQNWEQKVGVFLQEIEKSRLVIEREIVEVETSAANPQAEIQQTISELKRLWQKIETLESAQQENAQLRNKLTVTENVIQGLRKASREYRSELSDFSGRVASNINSDVQDYYKELHPGDDVVPKLDVSLSGNQRLVTLTCTYKGVPNRAAVSLLSESHRNSLGMSILLAFMKYKRHLGSPVEFVIFDDVTQSFDVEHRTNLLSFLENPIYPEIYNQQIIFLTHDRTLADLIKRPGEKGYHENWMRFDIRNWWLHRMVVEAEELQDPLNRAEYYINQHSDEIAAAVYARRGLEKLYKRIIEKTRIKIPYTEKPWLVGPDDYRKYILEEIEELWNTGTGFIDPTDANLKNLFTSQRILNLCLHDSSFLENPMTLGDVQNALTEVRSLETRFKCQCGAWYTTLKNDSGGNPPDCSARGCDRQLS